MRPWFEDLVGGCFSSVHLLLRGEQSPLSPVVMVVFLTLDLLSFSDRSVLTSPVCRLIQQSLDFALTVAEIYWMIGDGGVGIWRMRSEAQRRK